MQQNIFSGKKITMSLLWLCSMWCLEYYTTMWSALKLLLYVTSYIAHSAAHCCCARPNIQFRPSMEAWTPCCSWPNSKTRNDNKHRHLGRYSVLNLAFWALKTEDYTMFLWANKKNVHTKVPASWETFNKSQEVEDWFSFSRRCKMPTVTRSVRFKVLFANR